MVIITDSVKVLINLIKIFFLTVKVFHTFYYIVNIHISYEGMIYIKKKI